MKHLKTYEVNKQYHNDTSFSDKELSDIESQIKTSTKIDNIEIDYIPRNTINSEIFVINIINGEQLNLSKEELLDAIEKIRTILSIRDNYRFNQNKSGIKDDGTIVLHFSDTQHKAFQDMWSGIMK